MTAVEGMQPYMGGPVPWKSDGSAQAARDRARQRTDEDVKRDLDWEFARMHRRKYGAEIVEPEPELYAVREEGLMADKDQERIHQDNVQRRLEDLRVYAEAKALHEAEQTQVIELPPVLGLDEFLAQPDADVGERIAGLQDIGANVLLNAKAKSGKTTLRDNYVRALVHGEPFLGRFVVQPVPRSVTIVDFELSEKKLKRWLRQQAIRHEKAVRVVSMKGRAGSFDVRRDEVRARWAEALSGTDVLVIDALAPLLAALKLSESTEAGDLLPFLDALKVEAGISELFVVHHQGHNAERARGDSRLEGWPDAIWTLNIDDNGIRYLSARGRDVSLPETALSFDEATKRLTIEAGSRRDAAVDGALSAVIEVLRVSGDGQSGRQLEAALADEWPRQEIRRGIEHGVASRALIRTAGTKRAYLYSRTTS